MVDLQEELQMMAADREGAGVAPKHLDICVYLHEVESVQDLESSAAM